MKCYEGLLINAALYQVWVKKAEQRVLEKAGMKVVPCNFYSSVPSITEIENSFEYSSVQPPHAASQIFGLPKTNLDLSETLTGYSSEFQPAEKGSEESPVVFSGKTANLATRMPCRTKLLYGILHLTESLKLVQVSRLLLQRMQSRKTGRGRSPVSSRSHGYSLKRPIKSF